MPGQRSRCPACGKDNHPDEEICTRCGEEMDVEDAASGAGRSLRIPFLVKGGALVMLALYLAFHWPVAPSPPPEDSVATPRASPNPQNHIHDIKAEGGSLWVGTSAGVIEYDRKNGTVRRRLNVADGLAHDFVESIHIDRAGRKWFGTFTGVSLLDGHTWKTFDSGTTGGVLDGSSVRHILEARDGVIWIGTAAGGVCTFDGARWARYTVEQGLPSNEVHCIVEDRDGAIWVGTKGGVGRHEGGTWTKFTTRDHLVNDHVLTCAVDAGGNLWFGTWGGGLTRYDGETWVTLPGGERRGPLSGYVFASDLDSAGRLWLGAQGGVSVWDGRSWEQLKPADGLLGDDVYALEIDGEGTGWFGTYQGLSSFNPFDRQWRRFPR